MSFGPDSAVAPLQRMADIAQQVYAGAPRTANAPGTNGQPQCTFSKALDSVRLVPIRALWTTWLTTLPPQVKLTETFLGIAASLRKPRGSLIRG